VSFAISGGKAGSFNIVIGDRCPDGHILAVQSSYPTMTLKNGSFGGRFTPVRGHRGEGSTLNGRVSGQRVTGSIQDTSYSTREHRLCHGSVLFTATHT
jgi:hypothetical protein